MPKWPQQTKVGRSSSFTALHHVYSASLTFSFFLFFFCRLDLSTKCGSCSGVAAPHAADHPRLLDNPPYATGSSLQLSTQRVGQALRVAALTRRLRPPARYEVNGCQRPDDLETMLCHWWGHLLRYLLTVPPVVATAGEAGPV